MQLVSCGPTVGRGAWKGNLMATATTSGTNHPGKVFVARTMGAKTDAGWVDRPSVVVVDPSVGTSVPASPSTVPAPTRGPIPGFRGNFRDSDWSVSGLGAYRQYRSHPGKSFPMVALTVMDKPDRDKTTTIVTSL